MHLVNGTRGLPNPRVDLPQLRNQRKGLLTEAKASQPDGRCGRIGVSRGLNGRPNRRKEHRVAPSTEKRAGGNVSLTTP